MNIIGLEEKIVEAIEYAISEGWDIVKILPHNMTIRFRNGKINPAFTILGAMYFGATKDRNNPNWNMPGGLSSTLLFFNISKTELNALEIGWSGELFGQFVKTPDELYQFQEHVDLGKKLAEKYLKDK